MSGRQSKPGGAPVAIVGIGCRFPGGITDAESFWRLLSEGRDAITEIPSNRIDVSRYFDPNGPTPGRMMSRWGGFLDHIDEFDTDFFGISPREAERLDPQHRLLLETAWEALEDAGQDVNKLEDMPTGVFIGQWTSDFEARLFDDPEVLDFYTTQGSGRYSSSGRISYALGLRGPSLTVDTACSSSLVAVHIAVQSIRRGESQIALAGAANIILQPHISIAYSQSRMMAENGRCKFGDASGDGYVRSEGVAMVVLKALDRALAEGDRIYAVIRGSAINNDGCSSGSMGRPSKIGQEEVLRSAYRDAGLPAGRVQYVEAHGTGTRAGDPVELKALAAIVGHPNHRIYVGSVKTNFGHTEAAAGMAGLIKAVLALHHAEIPPSLHFNTPNPAIPWADLPFDIPRERVAWPNSDPPRIAGVTGFGISGTNAHVVLEEAPARKPVAKEVQRRPAQLLPLSAKSPDALRTRAARYSELLGSDSGPALSDVCWTAATRRTPLEHRAGFTAADRNAMAEMLRSYADGGAVAAEGTAQTTEAPKIAFICPGQGAQWVGMARELMAQEPEFRAVLERCDEAARSFVDWSIITQLTVEPDSSEYQLERIEVIQPVLVAIAIAYAALLRSLGVEPAAVVGHSMGEVAAACIAGVFNLKQGMRVICRRSALMQQTSGQGAMALVDLSIEEAAARLVGREDRVSVAVSNSPRSSVISGDPDAVKEVMAELERDNVFCRLVKVDVASHSPQMAPLANKLVSELKRIAPNGGRTPLWSTVLGRCAEGREFDASYWGRNLRETVRFTDAINGLLDSGISAFVELSPHPILLHSIAQTAQSRGVQVTLATCGRKEEGDHAALLAALGQLWVAGYPINWNSLMGGGRVVALPQYPWQRERHWAAAAEMNRSAPSQRIVREQLDEETQSWLFELNWEISDLPDQDVALPTDSCWLVVAAETEISSDAAEALRSAGATAATASLKELETAVEQQARRTASSFGIIVFASDEQDAAYLPVRVLQSVLKAKWQASPKLWFVTKGGQPVRLDGATRVSVDQAALWGTARVVGEEHPDLWGGLIDLDPASDGCVDFDLLIRHLVGSDDENQVAFRQRRRYALRLKPTVRERKPEPYAWRSDAAYLITGGLGGIGLNIARSLAARGVRRLILMARTPLPPREQWSNVAVDTVSGRRVAAIRELEAEGLSVHVASVDVGNESQLREFLDRYKAEAWPPICGVIHAAGAFNNQLAGSLSQVDFDAVVGPKLRGAQYLARSLPDLDLFVLISSTGAFLVQPGQANYAAANAGLDAVAHNCRRDGLHALSIGWGVWQNTGLVSDDVGQRNVSEMARQGIGTISPERGVNIFAWLCGQAEPHIVVLPIDWAKYRHARAGRENPMLKNLYSELPDTSSGAKLKERLAAVGQAERRQLVGDVVKTAVGKVLKIPPSRIDPRKAMGTMGLNSLMAMELRNRLEAELERPLSATLAWNYPTVEALVAFLADAEPRIVTNQAKQPSVEMSDDRHDVLGLSDEQAIAALRKKGSAGEVSRHE